MKKYKKLFIKIMFSILAIIIVAGIINFIPTWNLKTTQMHKLEGEWVNVYYEDEVEAAKDVFEYADSKTGDIAKKLGFEVKQNVNVFIYDHQSTMQTKKYGFIAPLLGLDWYIGDNIGTEVILTSPANPGKVHNYENNKYAVLHEIVHAYISVLNNDIDLWLTEGMALHLSNGKPFYKEYLNYRAIPTYKDTCTTNPIKFSNVGGYTFAHTYIEYLDMAYGWEKILDLIKSEDYEKTFEKTRKDIYYEWIDYVSNYYQ